jgi:hypothetical protein
MFERAETLIDPVSGQIALEMDARIGPATSRALFISTFGARATDLVVNEPWRSYRLFTTLAGMPFAVAVCFHGELLEVIRLVANPPTLPQSWAEWSAAGELQRKALHDKLLQQHVGQSDSTRTYVWGVASSVLDGKAGDSTIVIKYARGWKPLLARILSPFI